MAESRSSQALDWVKTGLYIYLGIKAIELIQGAQSAMSDNQYDAGGSASNCNFNANNLTLPIFEYDTIADGIQNAIWETGLFAMYERDDVIAGGLMMMNNLDDIQKLICVYKWRGAKDAASAVLSLPQSVEKFLDDNLKQVVNQNYLDRGINFQWL